LKIWKLLHFRLQNASTRILKWLQGVIWKIPKYVCIYEVIFIYIYTNIDTYREREFDIRVLEPQVRHLSPDTQVWPHVNNEGAEEGGVLKTQKRYVVKTQNHKIGLVWFNGSAECCRVGRLSLCLSSTYSLLPWSSGMLPVKQIECSCEGQTCVKACKVTPPAISWFINPSNYRFDISIMNPT
jgi:hypothetical protein